MGLVGLIAIARIYTPVQHPLSESWSEKGGGGGGMDEMRIEGVGENGEKNRKKEEM